MILALIMVGLASCAGGVSSPNSTFPPTSTRLQLATTFLPAASVGVTYASTLVANGGVAPYTWKVKNGSLPAGLQLSAAGGTIMGTPIAAGSYSFLAQVLDAKSSSATATLSISVSTLMVPSISSVAPNNGETIGGTAVTIVGNNFRMGAGVQFGKLFAATVRVMSPTQIQTVTPAESSGTVSVTVQNSDGQAAVDPSAFSFIAPLQIGTTSLQAGSVGATYSSMLSASGGVPPYSWSKAAGALPTGLQLNALTGVISGNPSMAGTYSFTAEVQDAKASSSSSDLSINISPDPVPTVTSVSPNGGPTAGGTSVAISGNNFTIGAEVQFGGTKAASVQFVSSTELKAVTPAESSGSVNVSVENSDGQVGLDTRAFTFTDPDSGSSPIVPTASSDPLAPKILSASSNSRAGDIAFIQGANFDSTSQAWLGGLTATAATQLTVINRVGQTWMAVQLPPTWTGAMVLWVSNSHGASKSVPLNGATPSHLDALLVVPGGAIRILGRNLVVPGYTPVVTMDGHTATLNLNASNENTLVITAPASLTPTSASIIMVDNGNGTGAVQLNRPITVVSGSGDPIGLGVGWGAGFTFAGRTLKVSTPCNGTYDDTANIQAAINSAASGGGVVQLPAGTCHLAKSIMMKSKVVLRGAGKDVTTVKYDSDYPIYSKGADLVGLEDFTVTNSGSAQEAPLWQQNTRSFILRVKIDIGISRQFFLTNNTNFVVADTDFVQRGSISGQGPYVFDSSAGLVFSGNTTTSIDGSPSFQYVHDALFINSHFTRDASHQNESPVVVTHRFVMDYAYRISIIGNTFDVINGPVTNKNRNDGETLLTEGGGAKRTENLGIVTSATATTISDAANTIDVNPFGSGIPENYGVAIVDGKGAGQTRELVAYSNRTIQVDHAWDVIPDTTSHYATFVWGLESVLIKGNTLVDNPRGIWLYQTAVRDVDILGNMITNGGGIYLRTFQSQAAKQFDPIYGVRIRDNKIANSNGLWMSYISVVFVNEDKTNFGVADVGIEIANNNLIANTPNVTSSTEDYAAQEGFMNLMRSENSGGQLTSIPMILGTIFQGNQCLNCSTAFVIGTGAYGTALVNNQPASTSPSFLGDWHILGATIAGSVDTVIH
jgi:hypothetical protein